MQDVVSNRLRALASGALVRRAADGKRDHPLRSRVLERTGRHDGHPREKGATVADPSTLSDAERARLEQRRDRLMKLMKDGDGEPLDAEDRADLAQEWTKIDQLLQRR